MLDNPYSRFIKIIREEGAVCNPLSFLIGKVINPMPEIAVKINGLQIDKNDIWISSEISTLQKGDNVLVLCSQDRQKFVIVSRVVRL